MSEEKSKADQILEKTRKATTSAKNVAEAENKSPNSQMKLITLDNSIKEVVELTEKDVPMVFDHQSFLELPEEVIRNLSYQSRNNYFMARGAKMAAKTAPIVKKRKILDPLVDAITIRHKRIQSRHYNENDRKWFHQAWIDPKFVDSFKASGYRNVRHDSEGKDDPSGSIVQMMNGDTLEAVALEIPYEIYEEHLHAMSEKSRALYESSKDSVKEEASRNYRGVRVLDEENPEENDYMNWLVKQTQRA